MTSKRTRQQRIRELLTRNRVSSQEQLQALLRTESIETTQATLSRDLREMGVTKREDGYTLPASESLTRSDRKTLERALRESLISVERAGNLAVLRTQDGLGPALVLRLNEANLPQVLGVVGNNDTLFVATSSWNQAQELVQTIRRLARM